MIEEFGSVKFVYEKNISDFIDGKSIDYNEEQGGFSITDGLPSSACGDCSC
jgi:Fe-S cluster assembly iron-binding protein IscA